MLILLGLAGRTLAAAQISPGPLARAHQSLNGAANCTSCHKAGAGEAEFRCLDCHNEIASRLSAGKGFHARLGLKQGTSQGCVRCHSDHNGVDFPLIKWDPSLEKFDHAKTGYQLEGKHLGLTCAKCHTAAHTAPAERSAIKLKDLNRTYLGLSSACITCHQDKHEGRLGQNCLQCHTYNDWKSVASQFDHSKTRYPLTGSHAQVACAKCHTPGADNQPRYTGLAFQKCSDCHADPHHGSFPQSCNTCHNTSGWKRVSQAALGQQFDHSRTKFPLLGKHQAVECTACHANGDFKKPLPFDKCMNCHKPDPHGGQFARRPDGGECATCHTVDGWKPSKFGVKEHAVTDYPLQAKHASVDCDKCHIPKGKDTVFRLKFDRCTNCHADEHAGQFAMAPYLNKCESCHNLEGYRPSTFTLSKHKQTRFVLADGHLAVSCGECHKARDPLQAKPVAQYHWDNLTCTSCHNDPHKGQFDDRMRAARPGEAGGCEVCHTTKSWKELSKFDHSATSFKLIGAHRATACIDCHKPANLGTRLAEADFKSAPVKCEDCHEEVHGRQFANSAGVTACADCHNSTKWKPSLFDHDHRTDFALQGVHRNVRCEACHKLTRELDGKKVLFYKPTPRQCEACHGPEELKKSG
jgi:hypothetical protein